jgi:hypothetical protein
VAGKLTAKFRYNAALPIAGVVALCGAVPLAASGWYLAPVLLLPLAVMVWGWRAGVDVHEELVTVRWGIGGRRLPATEIEGFTVTSRRVSAVLTGGRTVWLPAVSGIRVPLLAEAVGLRLADATRPAAATDPETTAPDPTQDADPETTAPDPTEDTAGGDSTSTQPAASRAND